MDCLEYMQDFCISGKKNEFWYKPHMRTVMLIIMVKKSLQQLKEYYEYVKSNTV